jgi:DNA invertase Pin-like site-specific DNA recombinase
MGRGRKIDDINSRSVARRNTNNTQTTRAVQTEDSQRSGKPNDTDRLVLAMRQAKVPGNQIAALFGVTKHAIYRRLKKFPEYNILSEDDKSQRQTKADEAVKLLDEGLSTNDLIDVQGWTRAGLDSMLHRRGVRITQQELPESAWKLFKEDEVSTHEIARKYGVARITVARNFRKTHPKEYRDITIKRKGGRKAGARMGNSWNVQDAYNEYLAGSSTHAIGLHYGKCAGTIQAAFIVHFGDKYKKLAAQRLKEHRGRNLLKSKKTSERSSVWNYDDIGTINIQHKRIIQK